MLDRPLVFLDVETTGAAPAWDRVTEVGLIAVEDGRVVETWSTLVNPERRIPPAIEALTGITNQMVALAPTFAEIADALLERIAGRTLVAHNARFDYGFLKSEFRRAERRYQAPVVCTVKLSRKLFPQHHRHGLDLLIERHGIECSARHRALGDAQVLWELMQRWRDELGAEAIGAAAQLQLKQPNLPPHLSELVLDEVPEAPGIYLFYGENDVLLYVGKSVNLRSRVLSHFSSDHRSAKEMRLVQQVRRVDWRETGGELGALLAEARLVKELQPMHNRQLRRNHDLCAWAWDPAAGGAPQLIGVDADFRGEVFGLFRSRAAALETLRGLAHAYELCTIRIGLEKGRGPCFAYQIKRCRGVCAGKESPAAHDLRLAQALAGARFPAWPFRGPVAVREESGALTEVHVLDRWRHLGTARAEDEIAEILAGRARARFDLDTYKILKRFFERVPRESAVIELAGHDMAAAPAG